MHSGSGDSGLDHSCKPQSRKKKKRLWSRILALVHFPFSIKLWDAARPLIATGKDLAQIRNDSLRSSLARKCWSLSHVQWFESMDSSEFLFGVDLVERRKKLAQLRNGWGSYTALQNGAWRGWSAENFWPCPARGQNQQYYRNKVRGRNQNQQQSQKEN